MDELSRICVERKDLADVGSERLHSMAQHLTVGEQQLVQIRTMGHRVVDVIRGVSEEEKKKKGASTPRHRPPRKVHVLDAHILHG